MNSSPGPTSAELRSKQQDLISKMEAATREFVEAIRRFACETAEPLAKEAFAQNKERADALGQDGLTFLKEKLNRLKSEMKDLAEHEFLQDKYWSHRQNEPERSSVYYMRYLSGSSDRNGIPIFLADGVCTLLGNVGKILYKVGLVKPGDSPNSWFRIEGGEIRYLGTVRLDDLTAEILCRYASLQKELSELSGAPHRIETDDRRTELLDRWEST